MGATPGPADDDGRLTQFSYSLADAVASVAPAARPLHGGRRRGGGGRGVGGRRRAGGGGGGERGIRASATMHEGFAGGAFVGPGGGLLGVATAISIRGLGVVIPARTAWTGAATLLEHGSLKRGYLGIVAHPVSVPEKQRAGSGQPEGLLVVGVKPASPAEAAGGLGGDILLALDW